MRAVLRQMNVWNVWFCVSSTVLFDRFETAPIAPWRMQNETKCTVFFSFKMENEFDHSPTYWVWKLERTHNIHSIHNIDTADEIRSMFLLFLV